MTTAAVLLAVAAVCAVAVAAVRVWIGRTAAVSAGQRAADMVAATEDMAVARVSIMADMAGVGLALFHRLHAAPHFILGRTAAWQRSAWM